MTLAREDVWLIFKKTLRSKDFCWSHDLCQRPTVVTAWRSVHPGSAAEFTAPATCNHVIATCHSTVHCVLLDISIKFYCKSVFKRPNLGIKTERYDGEASVFFSAARRYEAPIRCLRGGVFCFSYFQSPRQNVAQGRRSSSSCCCCCLLRPQCCACGSRPCVSSRCLLAEVMRGDQRGRAGR